MSEVIVITSGKGGVGKTTTVANIGTGLAAMGKRVAVVDTDIGLRNLDVVMGLENRIVYNLVDVINGSCRLKQALIRDRRHSELYLLPSAQTKDKTAVSPEQMIKLTDDLREEFDYVLLDCPAGIEQGFKNAVAGADRALVVTTPEVSAIRDADRIIGLLESGGLRDIRLIINRLRPEMIARGDMMSVEDVLEILAVDLIGAILDDRDLHKSGRTFIRKKFPGRRRVSQYLPEAYGRRGPLCYCASKKWCIPPSWQHFSKITDALLSDIFHHRRNDYGIFLREKPLCRLCTRQDEASSCIGTHRLFSTDDEAFTERSDTCRKKIRCN